MARACGSYPQCRGFKSLLRYHNGVSPSGKATDSDSVIRRFESCYPSSERVFRTLSFFAFKKKLTGFGVYRKIKKRRGFDEKF